MQQGIRVYRQGHVASSACERSRGVIELGMASLARVVLDKAGLRRLGVK